VKYFNNPRTGQVHAYDDDAHEDFIADWLVPMSGAEVDAYIASATAPTTTPADDERKWRDAELAKLVWLRDRHRDQLEIEATTTLTGEQFKELLVYMQALRDWPQLPGFPDSQARPPAPLWLSDQPE